MPSSQRAEQQIDPGNVFHYRQCRRTVFGCMGRVFDLPLGRTPKPFRPVSHTSSGLPLEP